MDRIIAQLRRFSTIELAAVYVHGLLIDGMITGAQHHELVTMLFGW